MPLLDYSFGHHDSYWSLDESKPVSLPASHLLGQLEDFLKAQINLLLLRFRPKAEPSGHSIILDMLLQPLALIELKCSGQIVKELLVVLQKVGLGFIGIVEVHEVNGLQP